MIYCHSQYFDTEIGRVIRALNGRSGIPESIFTKFRSLTHKCTGCLCEFSPDGYTSHLGCLESKDSIPHCMNMPGCPMSKIHSSFFDSKLTVINIVTEPSPAGAIELGTQIVPEECDSLHTPIGRSFLAWNSRIGIPQDVWALVSTAIIRCSSCSLIRTFEGHSKHEREGCIKMN